MEQPFRSLTVLSGGMGGARFIQGLLHGVGTGALPGVAPDAEVTVVANTADDLWVHGLKVCPDLDTVMYTLGDGIDPERGWGRRDETWSVKTELAAYGVEPTWFGLGDRDVATHLVRTQMLAEVPADAVVVVGLDEATPAPGVIDAITDADLVLLPPSNPVVSVGTILGVPRVREALVATQAPVVGVSPIIGGSHVRGMANQLLATMGIEVSAAGVGLHYGARAQGGVLDGWLVDESDAGELAALHGAGLAAAAVPLYMTDPEATAAMAAAAVALVS